MSHRKCLCLLPNIILITLLCLLFVVPSAKAIEILTLDSSVTAVGDGTQFEPDNASKIDPLQAQKQMQGNLSVGEFTGAAIYNYPIALSPGRNGMMPSVNLTYNSQDQAMDNMLGYHWSVNQYSIKRLNKTGVEKLYDENNFIATTPLESGELIVLSGNQYTQKVETTFSKYEFLQDNSWLVTDKRGVQYRFGLTENSRQFDPDDSTHIYQWMLEEIRDLNDNFVRFTYFKVDNQIYPKEILYTGYEREDGIFKVKFLPFANDETGEKRLDSHYGYHASFRIDSNYLINGIEVYADNNLRRKYEIEHSTVDPLVRNTIGSITETGYDINGVPTSSPPTTFEYTQSDVRWEETTTEYPIPPTMFFETCYIDCFVGTTYNWDMTGDGLMDFEYIGGWNMNGGYERTRLVNDGKGGWTEEDAKLVPSSPAYFQQIPNVIQKLTDYDGDTLLDSVQSFYHRYENRIVSMISLARGEGFVDTIKIAFGAGEQSKPDNGASLADLNGDGLPDIIQSRRDAYGGWARETCLNVDGTSCEMTDLWEAPTTIIADNMWSQMGRQGYIQDCNYDGLADAHFVGSGGGVWINDGKGGWKTNEPGTCHFTWMDWLTSRSFDANGDGFIDRVHAYSQNTPGPPYIMYSNKLYLNTGKGTMEYNWVFPIILGNQPSSYQGDAGVRIIDLNGDKLPDVMQSIQTRHEQGNEMIINTTQQVFINKGSRPYFLKTIHTSRGAQIDLEHKTSAQYRREDGSQANPNLSIIVDTVSKITTNDGMGNLSEINYLYEDGHYYFNNTQDKGYAGFRVVTVTDGLGYKSKTYYHQSENSVQDTASGEYNDHISKKGRPYRTEVYSNQGQLVQVTINKWEHNELSPDYYYPFLTQTLTKSLSGTEKSTAQSFTYDSYGNPVESINYGEVQANGNDGSFTDIGNDLIETTQSFTQNTADHLVSFPVESKVYDQSNQLLAHQIVYYDGMSLGEIAKGNPTKQGAWLNTNDSWITTQTEYNSYGLPTRQTNPRGYSSTTTYELNNLYPRTVTNAKDHVTQMTFDIGTGKNLTSTDPNNLRSENIYDGLGRLIESRRTSPTTAQMVTIQKVNYDDNSMPRSVFTRTYNDDRIEIDSYQYIDGLGRSIQSKQEAPNGNWTATATIYNERGNVQKNLQVYFSSSSNFEAINPNRIGNQFTYDTLNRVLTVTNPLGVVTNSYNGWNVSTTDPLGNSKTYLYNARNNLIRVDEINNGATYQTNYTYDSLGQLIQIQDAESNTRGFGYDSLGRRISQTKLNSQSGWSYEYDPNGNTTKRTDPKGQVAMFTYDELDRPLTEDDLGGAGTELAYTYDQGSNAMGRLSKVDGANYQHNFEYDLWGRILTDTKVIHSEVFAFNYTYDQMNGVKNMTYPDGTVINYSYNNAHLLDEVKGYANNFKYSPLGQITKMELANGVVTTNTYDPNQMYRLTDKTSLLHGVVKLQKYDYQYDAIGNLLVLNDRNNGLTAKTVIYEYDDLYRLTEARYEQTANYENVVQNYQYSPIGNMTFKTDVGLYTYSPNNPHAVIQAGNQTFAYDENGNMTVRNDQTMEYDYRNRMILNTGKAKFEYGEGYDRITKKDLSTGKIKYYPDKYFELTKGQKENKEVKYIYAGKLKIAKVEKITENTIIDQIPGPDSGSRDGSRTPPIQNPGHTPQPIAPPRPMSFIKNLFVSLIPSAYASDGTTIYYYLTDHLGSTDVVLDNYGNVVERADYLPFGDDRLRITDPDAPKTDHKFTGKEMDDETGLMYYGARYYDSDIGRFISFDPLLLGEGSKSFVSVLPNPQELNAYSYTYNNPVKFVDPTGEWGVLPNGMGGAAHQYITQEAIQASGVDFSTLENAFLVNSASIWADFTVYKTTDATKNSYNHSISDGNSMTALQIKEAMMSDAKEWYSSSNMRDFGRLLHMAQDSYSPAHAERDSDGNITAFLDFNKQSLFDHMEYDNYRDENYDIRSEALEAIDVTTKLIDYRFGGANWDVVEEYFDTEVFKGVSNENTTVDSAGKLFEKEDDDDEDSSN